MTEGIVPREIREGPDAIRAAMEHSLRPLALLALALARSRGANPDQPGWIERYHSQGLTHILGAGEAAT